MLSTYLSTRQAMLEAAIATTLYHPNVINTYAYDIKPLRMCPAPPSSAGTASNRGGDTIMSADGGGIMDWKLYIIQEYCDGGTLRDALDGSRFLDPDTGLGQMEVAVRVAMEVAEGMVYIHARHIIHGGGSGRGFVCACVRKGVRSCEKEW
ncbi:hypothetical protein TSOC_013058 [Tetrabaena socialis]|uniref:Protein kinase domain-containing protein n=1 Tax=Tetrabaena socialis TaxID=47790 RepID=A0A2J7ZLD2_9CHLO|nr:hypothetical protein TSOC_013058 [Tetrabaena socialis]|eukprot:PNH01072.1 hypothetical protein TSOC_013058 [Tetrabaena socialis]